MASYTLLPIPDEMFTDVKYGDEEFFEIHLDERFYIGENMQLHKVWETQDNKTIIEKHLKLFYDPDQCLDFITSYQWRKIFITLNDHFSYMLPLIHDLPQIIFIYIYSASPDIVPYSSRDYPKLRAIVNENSPDADKQLLEDIQICRRDLMPMNIINPVQRKTKLLIQEPLIIQDYSIVWIRGNNDTTIFDTEPLIKIIDSLQIFYNIEQCLDYIKSSEHFRIFFISSSLDSETILREVSHLETIVAIYLFDNCQQMTLTSTNSSNKIRGMYSDIRTLSAHLSQEYKRDKNTMSISIFEHEINEKTIRDLNKEHSRFLWLQLLVDILIKIPYNDQTKYEMLDQCQIHYKENKKAQKDIADFDTTYKSTEALKFYTNDSFLYRLFNRALRTENIDFLFIFRFFLADIYNHLQKLYSEQFLTDGMHIGKTLFLYRGQLMRVSEFTHIEKNVGHLISVGTFFSTSKNFNVASMYSGFETNRDPEMASVIFEIEIDLNSRIPKRPFASIEHLSQMPYEEEVLLSVGSIFRIVDIQNRQTSDGQYWYVKMKMVKDDDDINELREELEKKYCHNSNLCDLGNALIAMGDYDRAERYFRMLLEYLSETHSSVGLIYSFLGRISSEKGDYHTALQCHEQALKHLTKIDIYNQQENVNTTYVHIGAAHYHLGQVDLAMKYYSMAIETESSPSLLSYAYNQIAIMHRDKGDHHLALEYFQKTLHIEEQVLKKTKYNPLLATMYNNIGEIYTHLGDYENAFKYLQHALGGRLKGTVSTHTDLAAIYNNLGRVYQKRSELKKALEMFEKALEIDTQTLSDNHESLALSHNNIATIYMEVTDLNKALYHAETGLKILLRSQARDNRSLLAHHQFNLGMIQFMLGNHTKALKMAEKTLNNQMAYLPENHKHIGRTYELFSTIYEQQGDISKAVEYLEKYIEIARSLISSNGTSKFEALEMKLELLKKNGSSSERKYKNSKPHIVCTPDDSDLQDCILSKNKDRLQLIPADNIVQRIDSLNNLISVHSRKENFQVAMEYFDQANALYTQYQSSDVLFQQQLEQTMINVFFSASRVHYRQKNWTMSLKMLTKALDFTLKQTEEHPLLAEIYNCIGLSYTHHMDLSMAIHYHQLAINTAKKKLPHDHPDIQRYYYQLQQLNPLMGRPNP